MTEWMPRQSEPELMDDRQEAVAYASADFAAVNQAFVERFLELAGTIDSARALDLGTGPADIPIRLIRARPNWHVVAVDASPVMLELARPAVVAAGLSGRIELLAANAKDIPLADASFDVVFSNSILHHITDAARLWAQVRRLIRPGGLVFFRDLARPATPQLARDIVNRHAGGESALLQEEYYRSLLSAYTVDEVAAQLAQAGLRDLRACMITDRHMDIFGRVVR